MPGSCSSAAEVLEGVGERTEPALDQEGPQPALDPCRGAELRVPVPADRSGAASVYSSA